MTDRYAILIPTEGNAVLLHCCADGTLPLSDMNELVDGPIEAVQTMISSCWGDRKAGRIYMLVNEEGKLRHLPVNFVATDMISNKIADVIVGNAVLIQASGEDFIGFEKHRAEHIVHEWCEVEA